MTLPTPLKLERYLKLDTLLRQTTQRHTADSLGRELEVSERTIRSDIDFLRDRYYAPIAFTRPQGYHYTDPNWTLPSIPITEGELFALTLGARMLEGCAGSAYSNQLRSAIDRLGERLPETTWVNLQQLASESVLFTTGAKIDLDPQIWHDLETACRKEYSVQMTYYTASSDRTSDRILDPYLLHIYRGTNPYVIGYCHARQMVQWFRVDRIRQLTLLSQHFTRDPSFDPQQHFEDIFQAEVGGKLQEMEIYFDKKTAPYIRERVWHPGQVIIDREDGGIILKFVAKGLQEVKRWVLSYGMGAIVLQPPELVELVRAEIEVMHRNYQDFSK